jgi:maleate isomerase
MRASPQDLEGAPVVPRFHSGPCPRARIGFICVAHAGLTEGEMFAMRPADVGLHFTRVRMNTSCTVESLAGMADDLDDACIERISARSDGF